MVNLSQRRLAKYGWSSAAGFGLILLGLVPVRLALAAYQAPYPQAILTLGGDQKREVATAQLAKAYPDLSVWVSGGQLPQQAQTIFQAAGVSKQRLHLDYRATDTVTNFTTLIPEFKRYRIQHLYLVTSDFHMPRAKAIAFVVLGSQGIVVTPVAVSSDHPKEPVLETVRDIGRSLLWILTGQTGASLKVTLISHCRQQDPITAAFCSGHQTSETSTH